MKSYTVNSVNEAWKKANEIMPCDYMHDSHKSRNAGYDIYFSTCDSIVAWISDLGNRLEVNLPNGESVNVWIEEETEEATETAAENEATAAVEAVNAVKEMNVNALYAPTVCQKITICIDGGRLARDDNERKVYEALKRGQPGIEFDIIERYCDSVGLAWGTISNTRRFHVEHGKGGTGHFIVEGFVSARIGKEIDFLQSCANLLSARFEKNKKI